MPDGHNKNKHPSEIKSEAIPLENAEKMEALDDEIRDMVRSVITEIRPYVDAARIKQMFFDQMPNIMNGSRMQEVTSQARKKYENAVKVMRGHYADYADRISQQEFDEVIDDELRKVSDEIEKVVNRC